METSGHEHRCPWVHRPPVLGPGSKISQRFHTMGYRSPRKSFQPNHSHQRVWIHLESSDISHLGHRTPKTKQNKNCSETSYLDNRSRTDSQTSWKPNGKDNSNLRHKPDPFSNRPLISHRYHTLTQKPPKVWEYPKWHRSFMAWNTHPKELRCLIPSRQLISSNS